MAGFMQKFKEMWYPDEFQDDDETDEELAKEEEPTTENKRINNMRRRNFSSINNNRVVNINATAKLQVVLFKPEKFGDEILNIADELLKIHTIVLNLENTNKEAYRRIIDFLSGVAYANGGKIKKVATDTYVITPYNVDLTGDDVLDELENNGICL